jgi:predicted MPP superfamily phosphohydrolase
MTTAGWKRVRAMCQGLLVTLSFLGWPVQNSNSFVTVPTPIVNFIQITDLHLFDASDNDDATSNKSAFIWALSVVDWYNKHHDIDFVVFTGDIGLDCVDDPESKSKILRCKTTSSFLEAVEIMSNYLQDVTLPVYFVPGNNDLVDEEPCDIGHYRRFVTALNVALKKKGSSTRVVDLEQVDLAEEKLPVWLLGLNSASFKDSSKYSGVPCQAGIGPAPIAASAKEELDRFIRLVKTARSLGDRPILVFTHEPEIVDPYRLLPIWDLKTNQLESWHELLCNDTVTAVFAGHLHSQDFSLYGTALPRASTGCGSKSAAATWIAPPLAAKNQNPLAPLARGLLWVRVGSARPYQVSVTPLWYEQHRSTSSH